MLGNFFELFLWYFPLLHFLCSLFMKTSFRYQFSQTDLSLFFPYLFSIFLSFCFTFLEISLSLSYNPLTKFFICVIMFVISKSFFLISEVIFSPVASFLFHDRLVFCYLPKDIPDSFSIFPSAWIIFVSTNDFAQMSTDSWLTVLSLAWDI